MNTFHIEVSQQAIDDMRQRIRATRWPSSVADESWQRGVPIGYLKELADYWADEYDWSTAEKELNQFPQFTTQIEDSTVHFLHVRSKEASARPLLLTHGWPSSIVEFLDVIDRLTDPQSHGGHAHEAYHLVIPSLPGHGFSGPITNAGWDVSRVARAWALLMEELGYDRYITGGGDWGSLISLELARTEPTHVLGAYVTMLLTTPSGEPEEMAGLSESDSARLAEMARFDAEMSGYMRIQSTRPATIGFALNDSPVGLLAWIIEKFKEWNKAVETPEEEVGRDRLLTNASIYWLTGTATSAAQFYYESARYLGELFTPGVPIPSITPPLGVGVFTQDPALPIRSFAERDLGPITHWTEHDLGGHFPALEQPDRYIKDLCDFTRTLPR